MVVVAHNLTAMFTQRQMGINSGNKAKSAEKLSSGYKVNRSADNAAGLAISEKMRLQIKGLDRGAENIQEGVGYCKVADGALAEIQDMLHRMTELSVQAANGTNSDSDRRDINGEIEELKIEMDRICTTTKYNEIYVFKTENDIPPMKVYELEFYGYPDDMYIYNETYDADTKTATYGGIAYKGKRYSWSEIGAGMYDPAKKEFNEGTYTLRADDGTYITLVSEQGKKPPQIAREFTTTADEMGIYVNDELIPWENVHMRSGEVLDPADIRPEEYYFGYHGMTGSFTPGQADDFDDVIRKMTGTIWKSNYRLPNEKTALFADFSKSASNVMTNEEAKSYIDGGAIGQDRDYIIRAGDGTNGTKDGLWLEINGKEVADTFLSWAEVGITNWGNLSTDIWEDKIYKCNFGGAHGPAAFHFEFQLINETSKDSVIDALDKVQVAAVAEIEKKSHAEAALVSGGNQHIIGVEVVADTLDLSFEEEYGLGRDYSKALDEYGKEKITYKDGHFSVEYSGTRDSVTTNKTYENTQAETNNIVKEITDSIKNNLDDYYKLFRARYKAGASDPTMVNLVSLISADKITGGGNDTYLENAYELKFSDSNWKTTFGVWTTNGDVVTDGYYAGAEIDFSGLGTSYNLADLVGMGFNSTCQTCNNHYSIQFMTPDTMEDAAGLQTGQTADGYQWWRGSDGQNHTLYIDVASMQGKIANGITFTNALVDIFEDSGFDFHYTQYATKKDGAKLYIVDDRQEYARDGQSSATRAEFYPYAHGTDTTAKFTLNLYDKDNAAEYVGIKYQYDYRDLFTNDKLYFDAVIDPAGDFVKVDNKYVKYDANNPSHGSLDRYTIKDIRLDTGGKDLDTFLEEYVKTSVFDKVKDAAELSLVNDYTRYRTTAEENDNMAMVTQSGTPYQVVPKGLLKDVQKTLRIQCSSDAKDCILIAQPRLSVRKMGLEELSVRSEKGARHAIEMVGGALKIVNRIRSELGAYQNRLEHAYAINRNTSENTQSAESVIRDTDMAKEMLKYSKDSIIGQAVEAMLAQANHSTDGILSLLG